MAITFLEEKKRQKKLLILLVFMLVVTVVILAQWLVRKNLPVSIGNQASTSLFRKVDIDFNILENPTLKDLEPFEEIKAFGGKIGRENPFIPY